MSVETPVLIVGFNRPRHLARTIQALAVSSPRVVLLAIDGPRQGNASDIELCAASQRCVELITWPCTVNTRFRMQNLGIRYAVADAVNWAIDLFGSVIVLEDDAEPGPQAVSFAHSKLIEHSSDNHIGHINLYNLVPELSLTQPSQPTRLSRYPESYAWATWHRAWKHYCDDLSWLSDGSTLKQLFQNEPLLRSRRWSLNLHDALAERVDTWAYRWIASLWRHQFVCVSPNRNLVRYTGQERGTHTRRRQKWDELEIRALPSGTTGALTIDYRADAWLAKYVFRESISGNIEGLAATTALAILNAFRH